MGTDEVAAGRVVIAGVPRRSPVAPGGRCLADADAPWHDASPC